MHLSDDTNNGSKKSITAKLNLSAIEIKTLMTSMRIISQLYVYNYYCNWWGIFSSLLGFIVVAWTMVQVRVEEGILEGEKVGNAFGVPFYSFKGIPYAQPPIGDLRFKVPI